MEIGAAETKVWDPSLSGVLVCVCLTSLWCRQYLSLHRPISRTGKLASVLRDELLPPSVLQVWGRRGHVGRYGGEEGGVLRDELLPPTVLQVGG